MNDQEMGRSNLLTRRVLIVEDHLDSAESMSALLQLHGHHVIVAQNGPTALAETREFHPEVVVCDISLGGDMDGYAVALALRQTAENRPRRLIALSGHGEKEDIERALQAGFDAYMVKPVDPDNLVAEILK